MKAVAAFIAASLLLPGHVLAASEYDTCVQEEKTLRAQDKDRCSGVSYLLNPSGCFAVQKAIRAYNNGKCPEIIRAGSVQPVPNPPPSPPPAAQAPPPAVGQEAAKGAEQECGRLGAENARLKAENSRLEAEIGRLRSEIDQLGKR